MKQDKTLTQGYFRYGGEIEPAKDLGQGRISNVLSKAIAYERDPSLFDEEEVTERDKELLRELKQIDTSLCIDRRNKPVYLTSIQNRIITALSYLLSKDIETDLNLQAKIQNPLNKKIIITKTVSVSTLSILVFGSSRKRYLETIKKEVFKIAKVRQRIVLKIDEKQIALTAPLINIGLTMEDLTPDVPMSSATAATITDLIPAGQAQDWDYIDITFGVHFFIGLTTRYAVVTPKMLEAWSKKGRGGELYSVLQSSLLSVYWSHLHAATCAEARVRKTSKQPRKKIQEEIERAKREALTYVLNVSTIKKRVTTDYDSNPNMKRKFWVDLGNAIEGYKEYGLITDAIISKGAKGQEKVAFIFAEQQKTNTIAGGKQSDTILIGGE